MDPDGRTIYIDGDDETMGSGIIPEATEGYAAGLISITNPKESPKFDWKGVQGINPNDFVGIAQKISYLDGYARQNSIDETVNITSIQLLYAEGQIYTFRVIWRSPNEEQPSSSAIMSAKYSYGKWTITGLKARSFREQHREFLQSTEL